MENTRETHMQTTVALVASYLNANNVTIDELPDVIRRIYNSVRFFVENSGVWKKGACIPSVPVDQSVFDTYLACLEDGKHLKVLKQHLKNTYGMTFEQYKQKWNLPHDYPTVAPRYAKRRSDIARGDVPDTSGKNQLKYVA
jgi:predicted transcriptional regulator